MSPMVFDDCGESVNIYIYIYIPCCLSCLRIAKYYTEGDRGHESTSLRQCYHAVCGSHSAVFRIINAVVFQPGHQEASYVNCKPSICYVTNGIAAIQYHMNWRFYSIYGLYEVMCRTVHIGGRISINVLL